MANAIFTTKVSPSYDDRPEEYYHFPRTYLNQVHAAVGDHIIYYEPRRPSSDDSSRGGRQAYFATARIDGVIEDKARSGYFYALVSNYLDFDTPVPFAHIGAYYESALRKSDGTTNKGAFGRAVRLIPEVEFDQILKAGFAAELGSSVEPDLQSEIDEPLHLFERPIVELTISRPFRDQSFKRVVRSAYNNRCAFTGLQLINGGGRPEVQAAHIMPVSNNGPDSIRNGLALSGTIHWMFDRGLVSINKDYRILVASNQVPEQLRNLFNRGGRLVLPTDRSLHPHPHYLKFHRETIFKG
ncbi:MAG: HNH endonuclease [Xanthobacteraceae bacterium]|nr:HNH endonuclease [Xanthobacteraceae bacterium]